MDDNTEPFVTPQTSAGMKAWVKGLMLQCSMRAAIDCNKTMVANDFRAELARIKLPTLVIHGDRDASAPLPLTGQRTADLIPGSELRIYQGAPHGLFVTHTQQLNADLLAFAKG